MTADAPSTEPARPRVLCVDDEAAVLQGLERLFFDSYEIVGETSPSRALERLSAEGRFDVVVSDMRMPKMDGAAFLAAARVRAPDSVRILLTGQSELADAVAAVNDGGIFRFLCKPCRPEMLSRALADAVRHAELERAERELLEKTLGGAVRTLTEMLSLLSPAIFRKTSAMAAWTRHLSTRLELERAWRFEAAARLCHVGCVALPPALIERSIAASPLTPAETAIYESHPRIAHRLLINIPRLEEVALMVLHQLDAHLPAGTHADVLLGARMLRLLHQLDSAMVRGVAFHLARSALKRGAAAIETRLLDALRDYVPPEERPGPRKVALKELLIGMILEEDVVTPAGMMIVGAGSEVTPVLRERLLTFARGNGVREPLVVRAR